jgi:hypothetical protein
VERNTPFTSILLVVERNTPFTSILLVVERNTPCMSKLQVVEIYTPCRNARKKIVTSLHCSQLPGSREVFCFDIATSQPLADLFVIEASGLSNKDDGQNGGLKWILAGLFR